MPRKFIVTIHDKTGLDVFGVQEAIVDAAQQLDAETMVDHGSVDVQLVETTDRAGALVPGESRITYRELEVC